jgi:two-component system response regulator PilR (NtrC family)
VIDVYVPSLRERIEDVPELAEALLHRIAREEGNDKPLLDKSAIAALCNYSFPGNVRELENMLERALALSDGATITAGDLQFSGTAPQRSPGSKTIPGTDARDGAESPTRTADMGAPDIEAAYGNLEGYQESIEKQIISKALEETRWNRTATAKLLGISFRSLRYRLKKLGLED